MALDLGLLRKTLSLIQMLGAVERTWARQLTGKANRSAKYGPDLIFTPRERSCSTSRGS